MDKFLTRIRASAPYEELAGLSQQAADYASKFGDATRDVISQREAESFARRLEEAHNAKAALVNQPPADRDERLRAISEIAGSLRAEAATLLGSASQLR